MLLDVLCPLGPHTPCLPTCSGVSQPWWRPAHRPPGGDLHPAQPRDRAGGGYLGERGAVQQHRGHRSAQPACHGRPQEHHRCVSKKGVGMHAQRSKWRWAGRSQQRPQGQGETAACRIACVSSGGCVVLTRGRYAVDVCTHYAGVTQDNMQWHFVPERCWIGCTPKNTGVCALACVEGAVV
jgi:hypothetical protein